MTTEVQGLSGQCHDPCAGEGDKRLFASFSSEKEVL
jgi:hypothetical protein